MSVQILASCENLSDTFFVVAKSITEISLSTHSQDENIHVFNDCLKLSFCLNRGFFIPSDTVSKNYGGLDRSTSVRHVLVSGKANPVQFATQRLASLCGDLKHHKEAIMPNQTSLTQVASSVRVEDGHAYVTSNELTKIFGKRHSDILRDIENLECSDEFKERNFALSNYKAGKRHYKNHHITRDGFAFLAMGFTGKKAAQFKEAYIQAFNQMECQLAGKTIPADPISDIDFMHQRWLVVVEKGVITNKRALNHEENLFNRKHFINYFKEPWVGFNQIDELMELSRVVNERLVKLIKMREDS